MRIQGPAKKPQRAWRQDVDRVGVSGLSSVRRMVRLTVWLEDGRALWLDMPATEADRIGRRLQEMAQEDVD